MAALLVQGAFLAWLTWPLAVSLPTHRPSEPAPTADWDGSLVAWALAYETRALTSDPTALLNGGIYHPSPSALFYGEPAFGALPFFAPPFIATGNPTLALNLTLLLPLALTAACLQLVVQRWTASALAGVLAGWVFLNVPWVLDTWVPSAPNYASLYSLPLVMFLAAAANPGLATLAAILVLAIMQALVSPYLAIAVVLPLGTLAAWRLLRPRTRRGGIALLAVVAGVLGVTYATYHQAIALHTADPDLASRSVWKHVPLPLFLPGDWCTPALPTALPMAAWVIVALGFAARTVRGWTRPSCRRRAWGHAALWTVLGFIFSLTPQVILGSTPTPEALVPGTWGIIGAVLPTASRVRVPMRIGVLALVGLCVATGIGWAELSAAARRIARRLPGGRRLRTTAALATCLAAMWAVHGPPRGPFPLDLVPDESHDPVMQALMRSTGAVLELPIAGPGSHAAAMYRAIAHRHPLLNGYSGYWPREFEQRIELACRLPDVTALRQLARETDVELILVNRHGWGRPGARPPNECPRALKGATRWQTWQRLARTGHPALTLVARQDDRLLFRVQPDSHM